MAGVGQSNFALSALASGLDNQEDCDVFFMVDGQTIGAHQILLKLMHTRCEVLYNMTSGWNFGDDPILIDNMELDAFKDLLRYIYTGEIIITNNNVVTFLSAAVQFEMRHLEELCVEHLSKLLCTQNVCHFMNEAINFTSTLLAEKCQELFSNQTHDMLKDPSLLQLQQPALSVLLDVETTNAIEIQIFYFVEKWMRQMCQDKHLPANGTNMRQVIGDALFKIRFPTMNAQDFANYVTTIKGFLTGSEIAQTFQKIMVFDNKEIECPFPHKFRCHVYHLDKSLNMFKLLNAEILGNNNNDVRTMFKSINDMTDYSLIPAYHLRLVIQCCADMANSYSRCLYADSHNQNTRCELLQDFDAWKDTCETKNFHDTMAKYMEFRTKLSKICVWGVK